MLPSVEEQVVDFYAHLFDGIFSDPFKTCIEQPLRRKAVLRQVEESADAASQSLTRFLLNQQLTEQQVAPMLQSFGNLTNLLKLDDIANPNVTPEAIVNDLLAKLPCPLPQADYAAIYRVALHLVVQVLMLVGPVMSEWQKLNFSSTFELPRRVVNRLNQISEQIGALGSSGQGAADERYELSYRDYLLQRFHRVEAGTVRMTTNLDVDLRELFVMPRVLTRASKEKDGTDVADPSALLNLSAARKVFEDLHGRTAPVPPEQDEDDKSTAAFEQVQRYPRNVIVGAPGSGKSTFFEWLQVKVASAEEEFILGDQQAIPLLLRVRQLDVHNLPRGAALIEKATASRDRAALMPYRWIDRQMQAGRVLFMLDGLDETEPDLLNDHILPWLLELINEYPDCHYLVSSRPVGYPPGTLSDLEFAECDLLDFDDPQIGEYARRWCTAVRLARNEPEAEARREGDEDGKQIVDGFKGNPYIRNLARSPLMLSAICLVNYFEGGTLPEDRALLYKLCVEGLLHHWDQRRGIHSEFTSDEKLRTCREVALTMQAHDRAEYEADKVQAIFAAVLGDPARAAKLLEHIRYRTGLLLERRPGIFAFAHLTFQEYLAARAVHEGNQVGVDADQLVREHDDGRWQEVIALYCGLTTTPAARNVIEGLIEQLDTESLADVVTEAYFASGQEWAQDYALRHRVLKRVAIAPKQAGIGILPLTRFATEEVTPIANSSVGKIESNIALSEAYWWLLNSPDLLDASMLIERLRSWQSMTPNQVVELFYLLHAFGSDGVLAQVAELTNIYASVGPAFQNKRVTYDSQAEIAFIGLMNMNLEQASKKTCARFRGCTAYELAYLARGTAT